MLAFRNAIAALALTVNEPSLLVSVLQFALVTLIEGLVRVFIFERGLYESITFPSLSLIWIAILGVGLLPASSACACYVGMRALAAIPTALNAPAASRSLLLILVPVFMARSFLLASCKTYHLLFRLYSINVYVPLL